MKRATLPRGVRVFWHCVMTFSLLSCGGGDGRRRAPEVVGYGGYRASRAPGIWVG